MSESAPKPAPTPADHAAVGAAVQRLAEAAQRRGMLWSVKGVGKGAREVVASVVRLTTTGTGAEDVVCGIGPDVPAAVENLFQRAKERTT